MTPENPQPAARAASAFAAIRSPGAITLFVLVAALGLGVDLWTKSYSWNELAHGLPVRDEASGHLRVDSDTVRAIPGWLHFKVTNQPTVIVVDADGKVTKKWFRDFDAKGILAAAGVD